MQTLTQPTLLLKPFANSGDKNTLPNVNTDTSNPQKADLTNGFPQITGLLPSQGGLPPERRDFNALGYLTTTYDYFYQAGGTFTFDSTISSAIGGYPLNARLWYTNSSGQSMILRSTKQNNTSNFNNGVGIGTDWVIESFIGVGLNEGYVSNCITKIPQDIKSELASDGTLTLKSGSICTAPDGSQYQTTSDVIRNTFGTTTHDSMIFYNYSANAITQVDISLCSSGNGTPPASGLYYKTDTNKIYLNGSESSLTLPIAIIHITDGVADEIKQVFNGIGYVGSVVFALPGVSVLIPNGRNGDGTLKSVSLTLNNLAISGNTGSNRNGAFIFTSSGGSINRVPTSAYVYNEEKNVFIRISDGSTASVVLVATTTGDIDTFSQRDVVRIATQEQVYELDDENVKLTGTQIISGTKRFVNTPDTIIPNFTKGTNPSTDISKGVMYAVDGNGDNISGLSAVVRANGNVETRLAAYKNASGNTSSSMGIVYETSTDKSYGFAPTPDLNDNSTKIATTAWVKAVSNSLMMPDYSAGVSKTHGTTYQAETNLLFCYSCDTAEYDVSSIEVSSDGTTWIQVGLHKTQGGGGNDQENVGQIFVPKDWYYRANGGGSSLCVAFPLIGG